MVLINYSDHRINCKIVYYGPEESGKTTNIDHIYNQLDSSIRSEIVSLEGLNERTLFFDFLSLDLGEVKGFKTIFSLYSVPGQAELNAARKILLNGVDGIIFVADSSPHKLSENINSLNNLSENLKAYGLSSDNIPIIIQYNKRDLEDIMPLESLEKELNKNLYPSYEAIAIDGTGVFACLKSITNLILTGLQ